MGHVPSIRPLLPEISVRPISDSDLPFLATVYASTCEEQLARSNWSDSQKPKYLAMQFDQQHRYYQQHYPQAAFDLILFCDKPIGRIYTDRLADEIRLIELALLPDYRNQKIGTAFLQAARTEARCLGRAIRLQIEQCNRAVRLCTRLGFQPISCNGVYYFLEWRP